MNLLSPALVVFGFVLGSIPTGVLLGRLVGRDPRKGGSGNIGATNVTRTMGKKWGAFTLLIDVLKGVVPTLLAARYSDLGTAAATGLSATLGHCFTPFLRFKGGKGVATAFGAMAALALPVALFAALLWVAVAVLSRVPAIGSLAAAAAFVVLSAWGGLAFEIQLLAIALAVLVVARHQSNLRALKTRKKGRHGSRR